MMELKNNKRLSWSTPAALLALSFLSFGLLIPWLGFYWDDWPTVWYLHLFGPLGFHDVFAIDRPLLGYIFRVTTSLVGMSPVAWQAFSLLTRWAAALSLWWTLSLLWPTHRRPVAWVALLFVVYPGFLQQPVAVTYSSAWIIIAAFFLSLGSMIWAVRKPRTPERRWLALLGSLLLAAFAMFSTEYFFGLELLRPLLLWIVLKGEGFSLKERLQRIGRIWTPYIVLMAFFLFWRIFLHETPRGQVQVFDQFSQSPFGALLNLGRRILNDIFLSSLGAWGQVFNLSDILSAGLVYLLPYIAAVSLALGIALLYLLRLVKDPNSRDLGWGRNALFLGLFSLLVAGLPFWSTGLPIRLEFPWDRFTLAMMLGASLLLAGFLELLPVRTGYKAAFLALLIGLSVGHHFQNANRYRIEWNLQKDFFWQLSWRAPHIAPGTTMLTAEQPFTYYTDNSLTAPLNWIYAPENKSSNMDYMFYSIEARLGNRLTELARGEEIDQPYRATTFDGSTSQSIVLFYEPPGCVKVVNPKYDARLPQKPNFISEAMRISNPGEFISNHTVTIPPHTYFGPEPAHGWCYYFEKAELARQFGDWAEVAALGDEIFARKEPVYDFQATELLPYIDGYAHVGRWEEALDLSLQAYDLNPKTQKALCATWTRIQIDMQSDIDQNVLEKALKRFKCAAPG